MGVGGEPSSLPSNPSLLSLPPASSLPLPSKHSATFYGNGDGFSIHHGSCGFGAGIPSNLVAALSDADPEHSGSCGACFEVECVPGSVRDGYGESLERGGACKAGRKVVVKVTDTW